MSPAPRKAPEAEAEAPAATVDPREEQRRAAAGQYVSLLFDEAFELNEQYEALLKARKANRESLRQNVRFMDDEQKELLEELHPERTVTRRTPEERAAFLEQQATAAREKATKAAANGDEPKAETATTTTA